MALDDRLGALGTAVVADRADLDAEGPLIAVRGRARRRRQRRRLVGASIAAVVIVAVGGVALAVVDQEDAQRVTTEPPEASAPPREASAPPREASAPPPVDRSAPHLWLSAEQVAPSGGDVAVVLVDPTSSGDTWGVAAGVERWNAGRWERLASARLCLDFWGCVGQIGGVDGVELIGLSALPVGPLTWLGTGALEPGWYRLTQTSNEGTVAAGQFEVQADAAAAPSAAHEPGTHLVVEPTVLFASEALRRAEPASAIPPVETSVPTDLTSQREIALRATSDLGGAPRAWQDGRSRLERWDGTAWVDATELRVGGFSPGIGAEDPLVLTLGDPPPGAYRVLVETEAVTLDGRFWVTELE
jgi:hypothetical protein